MSGNTGSSVSTAAALAAALALVAAPATAAAASCSCTLEREKTCIDSTSAGRNALCEKRRCPASARFSTEACPGRDLIATCTLEGPGYASHNRYYAPRWKPEVVKGMCASMKGKFEAAPAR